MDATVTAKLFEIVQQFTKSFDDLVTYLASMMNFRFGNFSSIKNLITTGCNLFFLILMQNWISLSLPQESFTYLTEFL